MFKRLNTKKVKFSVIMGVMLSVGLLFYSESTYATGWEITEAKGSFENGELCSTVTESWYLFGIAWSTRTTKTCQ